MPAPKGPRPITKIVTMTTNLRNALQNGTVSIGAAVLALDTIIAQLKARDASSDTPDVKRSKLRRKTARTPARTTR